MMRQYGIGISDLKIMGGTMYSCVDKARQALKSTHLHSAILQKEHVEKNWAIANTLQTTQAPMFVKDPSPDTFFCPDDANRIIRLTQWSSGMEEMGIDISFDDIMRFTNTASVEEGAALVEFACQVPFLFFVIPLCRSRSETRLFSRQVASSSSACTTSTGGGLGMRTPPTLSSMGSLLSTPPSC